MVTDCGLERSALSGPEGSASVARGGRLGRSAELMSRRVENILLVATPYDSFVLEEDGLLTEMIFSEYADLGLSNAPSVTRASSGEEALAALARQRFDLIITMLRLGDLDVFAFAPAARARAGGAPLVLLVPNEAELVQLGARRAALNVDQIYVWYGDAKLFVAIVKLIEDAWNVEHDTQAGGVGVLILVEDSVRHRSSLLPLMYGELVQQTRSVMRDGLNRAQRLMRLRARPKILVAESYEAGVRLLERYREHLFGVIADVAFPRGGQQDPRAGIDFIRYAHELSPDLPALLQSSDESNRVLAEQIGVSFLHKRSKTLLEDLRRFMLENFGFGDFVFRTPDRQEVGRARDIRQMCRVLRQIPGESLEYHARRNHFSNWLRARTEFELAQRMRPRRVSEFKDLNELRGYLIQSFEQALRENRRGVVEDFDPERFDATSGFWRIGGGSLGGKARGLVFLDAMLARHASEFDDLGVRVYVPPAVVLCTDVFDQFIAENRLRTPALDAAGQARVRQAFLRARLPEPVAGQLRAYLELVRVPLAVRSSSLLEDSQYYPLAGVYDTHMIPNNEPDEGERFERLAEAIKLVYASTYCPAARQYLEATGQRLEEQRMAVILQPVVGAFREHYFYPSFAGVARSYNFYPFGQMKPEEGVASVALGLGQTVVEGGPALRFCPRHPHVLPQMALPHVFLEQSQRSFLAIDLAAPHVPGAAPRTVVCLDLEDAERHGTLQPVGSVWSVENEAFYDGIYRPGARAVTFAHVLKSDLFPLAAILTRVQAIGERGMGGPVEFEFAVELSARPPEFAILQMRPYGRGGGGDLVEVPELLPEQALCFSDKALGHGVIGNLCDVVYIRPERFDAACTRQIAQQVAQINAQLREQDRGYVLIGPGRWGTSNEWLGIPVSWGQISGARVIVEAGLDRFVVDPSQGTHFFHNLTSQGTAYLTVDPRPGRGYVDWSWLEAQPAEQETAYVRHVRLGAALEARIDGRTSRAVIFKPGGHGAGRCAPIQKENIGERAR